MMDFYFVSLPKYIPRCSTMHSGASIDWKGTRFAYIWGHVGAGVTDLTLEKEKEKEKEKRDMWHLGGVFYSFNVKTKIPPLSTFVYDIITINQIRKTQNVSPYQRCLRVWGV